MSEKLEDRMRMRDPHDPQEVRRAILSLDELRRAFRATLQSTSPEHLQERPAERKWSALEHTRHLLFAESLYINHWILRNGDPISRLGLAPHFLADKVELSDTKTAPNTDLKAILSTWDEIHERTLAFLKDATPEALRQDTRDVDYGQGSVGGVLQGMVQHDLYHIRKAEEAIEKAEAECSGKTEN